jgi:hypothetical protein
MVNPILLEILKLKIASGEITIDRVKLQEYMDALNAQ